ncbi:hypothetical protein [Halovivax ruber]|nr:hypothetical protein [Halovivax ruber]
MGHLRVASQVANGADPLSILYPGMPALVEVIRELTGLPARIVLVLVGPIFFTVFVVFSGLIGRQLTRDPSGLVGGVVAGLLLLPINLVATHLYPHPNSYSILFAPVGLFLAISLVRSPDRARFTALLFFAVAMIVYHPQQAMNVIAVLAVFGVVWALTDTYRIRDIASEPLVSATAVMGVLWMTWILAQSRFEETFVTVVIGILSASPTDVTAGRGGTLTQLGSGVVDLVFRLFFIDIVASFFAGIAVICSLVWAAREVGFIRSSPNPAATSISIDYRAVFCLCCAFVPVMGFFGVFLASGVTQQFMRFIGFGMALATILVAVGLRHTLELSPIRTLRRSTVVTIVAVVLLTSALVGASLTYHTSPLNFRDTGHVSEASVVGYDTQFDHHAGVEMMHTRTPIWRYAYALEPMEPAPMVDYTGSYRDTVPPDHFANRSIHELYDTDRLLLTTEKDRWLDTELYDGVRYSDADFRYLIRQPGIDRTYDNGGVQAYYIHSNETS